MNAEPAALSETADGVELQINLAPTDLPHLRTVLPHQLRCWGGQADGIQLTLDLHRSRGRYSAGWEERLPGLRRLLDELRARMPRVRIVEVDYSAAASARVSAMFFGAPIPAKDQHGAPFYAYFFGLASARHRYVMHMDSDMLFGGGSQSWVGEAIEILRGRPHVIACNPLPGPPSPDGGLRSQTLERASETPLAYRSAAISTRIFLIDTLRLAACSPLPLIRPRAVKRAQCVLEGRPGFVPAEKCLSAAMARHGMQRLDVLGNAPGMWAVHPPFRSAAFYATLPALVARIEAGDIPEAQRGRHDIDDSLVDWSDVRPTAWRRLRGHARLVFR